MASERDMCTPGSPCRSISRRSFLAGSAGAAALAVSHFDIAAATRGGRAVTTSALNQDAQAGGTLTYGLNFDVDGHLDPGQTCYDSTIRIMLNVCEPLVWMPTATDFVPNLAESWTISEDGLEYTFVLKQGVTFHDGTPFNAAAVQFTFDRLIELEKKTAAGEEADPETVITPCQGRDQIGTYDHSEVIDDYTIKMVLSRPFSPFLSGLNGYLGIVSPTAVQEMGIAEFDRKPVGTGPYKVEEWVEADHVTLVKNSDYTWGSPVFTNQGAAFFDEIIYKFIPDASIRTGTLLSGETQYIDEVDALQLEDLQSNSDIELIDKPQPGVGWILLFNVAREGNPQMETAVRQALAWALDKEAFNQAVFGGANIPAASPLMRPTFAYEPKTEELFTFDPAKAGSLLDEAGWVKGSGDFREKEGKTLSLYWPVQDRPTDKAMATFCQGAWREIGVDLTVEAMERGAASEKHDAGEYDISFLWFAYADPDILRVMFHSSRIGSFNVAKYSDPEVDQMLDEAAASNDPEVRTQLYSQLQLKLVGDAVTIPLADSVTHNAKQKTLQGEILDFLAGYVWMNDAHFTE
jgi:peptide/nickel transport system substrate-binding protein